MTTTKTRATTVATKKTWSTVVDAVLVRDPQEGTYSLTIRNADGSTAERYDLIAVTERAAMLEATTIVKAAGWEPTTRTWNDDSTRRFRRAA